MDQELDVNHGIHKPLKFLRIQLQNQSAEAVNLLFQNKQLNSSNLDFGRIFPQLSHNQRSLLTGLYNHAYIICFFSELDDLNEGMKISLLVQSSLVSAQYSFKPSKLLLITKKYDQPSYFYLGFLDSKQKLFIQGKIQISLESNSKCLNNSFLMNCEQLYKYVKNSLDILQPFPSVVNKPEIEAHFEYQSKESKGNVVNNDHDSGVQNINKKLYKKVSSRSSSKKPRYQIPKDFLLPNSDGYNLRQYLNLIDNKVQIPEALSKLLERIPRQHSEYLLQGLLKKITKINKFSTYFNKFITQVALSPKEQQSKLFNKDPLEQNNISDFPLPNFSLFSFCDNEEFFPLKPQEDIAFLKPFESESHVYQNNPNNIIQEDIQDQNDHLDFFRFDKEELSEEAQILNVKIKNVLEKNYLKLRSTGQIAKKFLEAKQNGTITLSTRPQQLIRMKMNVGKHYCQVLHPLFMQQLKMQSKNCNVTFFKNQIEGSIRKIKNAISKNDQELPFENEIHSIIFPITLKQFCQLIKNNKSLTFCKVVHIQLSEKIKIQALIKYTQKGQCLYFYIDDYHHVYDGQFVFPLQENVTAEKLIDLLIQNKAQSSGFKVIHQKSIEIQPLSSLIQQSMIKNKNDCMTTFFQQTSFGKKLLILIKISIFSRSYEFINFKMNFKVLSNTLKYDLLDAYSLRFVEKEEE